VGVEEIEDAGIGIGIGIKLTGEKGGGGAAGIEVDKNGVVGEEAMGETGDLRGWVVGEDEVGDAHGKRGRFKGI
jgi:hypothetical protein